MNILSYTNCPLDPKSGGGKMVFMFSQGMRKLGHRVDVYPPEHYETWYGLHRAKKFRQAWGGWHSVNKNLKTGQYDLFEFCGDEFWLVTWRLSKSLKRPLVVAHTGGLELLAAERMRAINPFPRSFRNRLYDWFFRQTHERFSYIAFAYADAFVSLCELDRKHVLKLGLYPTERTAVVEPGIDGEYLSMPFSLRRQERVAFTGSWIARKGIDKVAAVMTRLLTQNPVLYLDLYGTGSARDVVLTSFPPQVHNRIMVYTRLSNRELANSLARAKVFFFPTRYEGFGIALAEAMACGCAAVTTPTGFGADLRHGKEVLICDFDDVGAMEHSILRLLNDDNMRQKIACKGWERVRSLNWDTSTKKLEAIYSEWIQEHRSRMRN